jgi:hypothetical protein
MTSARLMRMFPHAGGDGLEDWGAVADLKSGSPTQRGRFYFNAPASGSARACGIAPRSKGRWRPIPSTSS